MENQTENEMETVFIGVYKVSIKDYTLCSRSHRSGIVKGAFAP